MSGEGTEATSEQTAAQQSLESTRSLSYDEIEQLRAGGPSVSKAEAPDLRTAVWEKYEGDYLPPEISQEAALPAHEAFQHPSTWVQEINPGGPRGPNGASADLGRSVNCADCSRAVERNWRGESQVAAGLDPALGGEGTERTQEWSSAEFRAMPLDHVARRLEMAGPGSSAIVGVDWNGGGGHYFNAVNHEGRILAVDGQTGVVGPWPPTESTFGYGEQNIGFCEAIVRDDQGRQI